MDDLRRGVYPGSFDPLTVAHLAVADAARKQCRLDRVVLAVSVVALGKEGASLPLLEHRLEVLRSESRDHDWLEVLLTERRLVAEIAAGFDVVIMGADKWAQVNDPRFYADAAEMAEAIASLPEVAVAPRPPHPLPAELAIHVAEHLGGVSSTGVRSGRQDWMTPRARDFDMRSGAWTDPDRYLRWLAASRREREETTEPDEREADHGRR